MPGAPRRDGPQAARPACVRPGAAARSVAALIQERLNSAAHAQLMLSCPGRCLTLQSHHMAYRCRYFGLPVIRRLRASGGGRPGLALVEVSVVEQRYRAVLDVRPGFR